MAKTMYEKYRDKELPKSSGNTKRMTEEEKKTDMETIKVFILFYA